MQAAIDTREPDQERHRHRREPACRPSGHVGRAARHDDREPDEQHGRRGSVTGRKARGRRGRVQTNDRRTRTRNDERHRQEHRDLEDQRNHEECGLSPMSPKREQSGDHGGTEHDWKRVEGLRRHLGDGVQPARAMAGEVAVHVVVPTAHRAAQGMREEEADAEQHRGEHGVADCADRDRGAERMDVTVLSWFRRRVEEACGRRLHTGGLSPRHAR